MTILVLLLFVIFLAYSNGANDNFKGVSTLFGSNTINFKTALTWASISTLAGSICALFLAQALITKFSGKGLAPDALIQSLPFIIAVAGGAGFTVFLATSFGCPISTTHALIGALTGSALIATSGAMSLMPLINGFLLPLLLSPFIALSIATILCRITNKAPQVLNYVKPGCVCLQECPQPVLVSSSNNLLKSDFSPSIVLVVDSIENCPPINSIILFGFNTKKIIDTFHFISAGTVCFARGLNDTPKIAALLLLLPDISMQSKIILVAFAMLIGGLFNARKVAETMSHKITIMSPSQGLVANMTTATMVLFASKFGVPVSTTHVSVGSIFGIGLSSGKANNKIIGGIFMSWVLTLPCAGLIAALLYGICIQF